MDKWEGTYVTATAQVRCSCGSGKRKLIVADHNKYIRGHAQANITDNKIEGVFDGCSKRGKSGCMPVFSDWVFGKRDVLLDGSPVLLRSSKLYCEAGGGTITIVDDGQNPTQLSGIGAVGAKELFIPKPEEPKPGKNKPNNDKKYLWPVVGKTRISSYFAFRGNDPNLPKGASKNHKGLDIAPIPSGTKNDAVAMADGTVIVVQASVTDASGKYIKIDFGDGVVASYCHLDSIAVKKGQKVRQGQIIGKIGNTTKGIQDMGVHLHLTVRQNEKVIDPLKIIQRPSGV